MQKNHYIYTDNKFFRKLVKKNNEQYWDAFYDSIIQAVPTLDNGFYKHIFTCFSFLEAIGEGRIKTKHNHILNLSKFLLDNPDILKDKPEYDSQEIQILGEQLDKATISAIEHYKSHPELSKEKLLKKIDDQLVYSSSKAATELIENTLIRYKKLILTDYDDFLSDLSLELTWDSICSFDFLHLDKHSNGSNEVYRKRFRGIKKLLLRVFHDAQTTGKDLSSFRLCESIQKERLTSQEFIKKVESDNDNKKFKISIPGILTEELDLCDVDVIHYATLGYFDPQFDRTYPVSVFTCDDRAVIKNRVLFQLSILRVLANEVAGSMLKLVPGEIYFIDSKTGKIQGNPLLIDEIKESEIFEILYDPLPSGSESYVEFIRTSPTNQ